MRGKSNIQKKRKYTGRMRKASYRENLAKSGVQVDTWDSRAVPVSKSPENENTVVAINWQHAAFVRKLAKVS